MCDEAEEHQAAYFLVGNLLLHFSGCGIDPWLDWGVSFIPTLPSGIYVINYSFLHQLDR